jgi:putative transposase
MTTYHIWRNCKHSKLLKNNFWKVNTLWADGYFVCSVGDANEQSQGITYSAKGGKLNCSFHI